MVLGDVRPQEMFLFSVHKQQDYEKDYTLCNNY